MKIIAFSGVPNAEWFHFALMIQNVAKIIYRKGNHIGPHARGQYSPVP
jgi:hypothetical protein